MDNFICSRHVDWLPSANLVIHTQTYFFIDFSRLKEKATMMGKQYLDYFP